MTLSLRLDFLTAAVLLIVVNTSCVSSMDADIVERSSPIGWEAVERSDSGAEFLVEDLGIYSAKEPSVQAGLASLLGKRSAKVADGNSVVVLGPGDVVTWATEESPAAIDPLDRRIPLDRRTGVTLVPDGPAGPVEVVGLVSARSCEVVAYQSLPLVERQVVEVYRRAPQTYVSGGETLTASEVDTAQALSWILTPPVELGRLVTRLLGGRFIEPVSWTEELVETVTRDDDELIRHAYVRPVADHACEWRVTLAGPAEEEPIRLTGRVKTAGSGRAVIPLWEHGRIIRENLDFGSTVRLQIMRGEEPPYETTVDLLQVELEAPK